MRKAVFLMGPPGAGKGTQAELISDKFGLIHLDTGRYLELLFNENRMPLKIRKEFKQGDIVNPFWVLKVFKELIKRIGGIGFGIVFSGSLRTVFEAFGDGKNKGIILALVDSYGKKNILVFELDIPPEVTILRNSKRKICSVCGKPHLLGAALRNCPFCGGKLIRRVQDKPSIIKNRLKEYKERTKPVLKRMRADGFKVIKIDGRPKATIIFNRISRYLK